MAEIDVIMPVRNGQDTVAPAALSILGQTLDHVRLIVIDDGSTDNTADILARLADKHANLTLVPATGSGIVAALNQGLDLATAPYIARMDADDVAFPWRLERQKLFMDAHPDVAMLGTRIIRFGEYVSEPPYPITAADCRRALTLYNPFCHPSVMIRAEVVRANGLRFRPEFEYVEDYEFFCQIARHGEVCNLDEPLMLYRIHANQVSRTRRMQQFRMAIGVADDFWLHTRGGGPSRLPRPLTMLQTAAALGPKLSRDTLRAVRNYLFYRKPA